MTSSEPFETKKKPFARLTATIGLGLAAGIPCGLTLGSMLENTGLGLALGITLCVIVSVTLNDLFTAKKSS